jgi:hypothetical protein
MPAEDEGRQEQAEWALRERGEAGGRRSGHDAEPARDPQQPQPGETDRDGDGSGEQHVHRRGVAVGERQERRAGHEPRVKPRCRAEEPRADEGCGPDQEDGGQDRGKACGSLGLAEEGEGASGEPVVEGRLLEPGAALQGGRHPCARAVHLDGDARVARLVRPHEGQRAETEDEEGQGEREEEGGAAGREGVGRHRASRSTLK